MQFFSVTFLGMFFPIVILLYFSINNRIWRNIILLMASICFYACGNFIFTIAIILLSLLDYALGILIGHCLSKQSKVVKFILIGTVILNFSASGVFTYIAYKIFNISKLYMPLGIIIFVFQAVSYILDVYKEKTPVQKNYFYLLFCISFFPQICTGPIIGYRNMLEQFKIRKETFSGFLKGSFRFFIGIVKIVLLANYAKNTSVVLLEKNISTLSVSGAWVGMFLFSIYVFLYFSGYSDIAIGLAEIFGFSYKENFNYPYMARGINDFWERCNISFNSFLNEYLGEQINKKWYFPYIKVIIGLLIIGLWHGLSINFIIGNVYFLILLMIERRLVKNDVNIEKTPIMGNIISTLTISFGWGIFYYKNVFDYGNFVQILFALKNRSISLNVKEVVAIREIWGLIPIFIIICTHAFYEFWEIRLKKFKVIAYGIESLSIIIVFTLAIGFSVNQIKPIKKIEMAYGNNKFSYIFNYYKGIIRNDSFAKAAEKAGKEVRDKVGDNTIKIKKNSYSWNEKEHLSFKKEIDKNYKVVGDYLILQDRAFELFHYNKENLNYSLETYNNIMKLIPSGINKYFLIAPMRVCFENDEYKKHSDDLKKAIDEIYINMSKDVVTIDAYRYLEAHKNEKIFLNTDYYWTALGAYYGAQAFCNNSSIQIRNIDNYELRSAVSYVGAFSYIKEGNTLTKYPENVDYYIHKDVSNTQLVYKYDKNKKLLIYKAPVIAVSRRGYNIFIGDNVAMSVIEGNLKNGRVLVIMGNEFIRAFAPWLIPNYEKIILVNPIHFKGRKLEFEQILKDYNVTDFMLIEYGNHINSKIYNEELRKICLYKK